LSLRAFQAELDAQDGADRASRAGLVFRLRAKDDALRAQAASFALEQQHAARARLSMHGLRAQLRNATDTIDGIACDIL
jgi:gamma-glutamylcysteine synthetase